ncbi:MAG: hypothetical protein JNK87_08585 [Bryobacterales bacterium]|nr:hypothetical protein [Bryobacterales bacterium]
MVGIQYLTDEQGRKVAVQIDLAKHGQLWEDLQDAIVTNGRRKGKGVPIKKWKASQPEIQEPSLTTP